MSENATIIYIKGNEEYKITFNKMELLNPNKKLMNIFKKQEKRGRNIYYTIDDDIELIYIKNYTFKNSFELKGENSKNVVLILDDCTFCDFSDFTNLSNVELLSPNFKKNTRIEFDGIDDVNVVLDEDINFFDIVIDVQFVKNFSLKSAPYLKLLNLNFVRKTILSDFNSLVRFIHNYPFAYDKLTSSVVFLNSNFYDTHKLKIDNHTKLNMKLVDSNIMLGDSDYFSFVTNVEKLELVSSKIWSNNFLDFSILKSLTLNNSSIKSDNALIMNSVNEIKFCDIDDTILDTSSYLEVGTRLKLQEVEFYGSLIVDKEFLENVFIFKRQSLINVLNKYKEKILEENERKVNEIEEMYQKMIDDLIQEKEEKKKEYIYVLENKKIKEL